MRSTGAALERIVAAAGKVSATVAEISSATAEQAHGIEEMSQTVAHMDETTQANSALAEQSATSATELTDEISRLRSLVAFFRTEAAGPSLTMMEPARLQRLAETVLSDKTRAAAPAPRRPQPLHNELAASRPSLRRRAAGGGRADDWAEF